MEDPLGAEQRFSFVWSYARGIRVEDIVRAVGEHPTTNRADVLRAIADLPGDQPVRLRLRRAGAEVGLTLHPPWRGFLEWIESYCVLDR